MHLGLNNKVHGAQVSGVQDIPRGCALIAVQRGMQSHNIKLFKQRYAARAYAPSLRVVPFAAARDVITSALARSIFRRICETGTQISERRQGKINISIMASMK